MKNWHTYLKQGLSSKLPEDRISGQKGYSGLRANLKNLHPIISRHWRKGLLGFLLIIISSLFNFPQPLIFRYIVDDVILDRQVELLMGAVILLIIITVIAKLTGLLEEFYVAHFEQQMTLHIQQELLERTMRFPKLFFDHNQTGYLMSRLSADVEDLRWLFSGTIVHIISNMLRFLGGIALLFYLEWRLTLVALVILPCLGFCVRYFSVKIHVLSHQSMEQHANVSSHLQESLSAASLIKAFSSEGRAVGQIMNELKRAFQISLEQITVSSVANAVMSSMPGIARVITLALGAYWVIRDQWTLGSLLAFQAYLGYVFGPAQFLATANLQLQSALAALERVSALFDIAPEENMGTGRIARSLTGSVDFENVSFSYDGRETVLDDVSFHIDPGQHVAIVGPSGVGKTTLVSLILRLYKPTSGEIYLDSRPASDYEVGSLRKRIGYVSQSPLLLSGTVIENIRYGNPEASYEQVINGAKGANIHQFITGLPHGYETEISENGINLSEGQKQRLSIARALVKDPDILVLDEPAAALDSLTEESLFNSLSVLVRDKTLFVVAHRLSTIRESDRILLLNENSLVAIGTHQSLLESNSYYRSLLAYQQGGKEQEQS